MTDTKNAAADVIAQKIMDDLGDRAGILDGVDDDIYADMYSTIRAIVLACPLPQAAQPVSRNDVIEECAMVCKELKAKWQSGECGHSVSEFDACEAAIRALKQQAPEPVAAEQYADKLVREYVAALLANDKDAAGKATCAMADYVMRPVNRAAIDMRNYALDARADLEKQNEKLKNQLRRWKDRAGGQE